MVRLALLHILPKLRHGIGGSNPVNLLHFLPKRDEPSVLILRIIPRLVQDIGAPVPNSAPELSPRPRTCVQAPKALLSVRLQKVEFRGHLYWVATRAVELTGGRNSFCDCSVCTQVKIGQAYSTRVPISSGEAVHVVVVVARSGSSRGRGEGNCCLVLELHPLCIDVVKIAPSKTITPEFRETVSSASTRRLEVVDNARGGSRENLPHRNR
mmetsp:Transcript_9086/g.16933  ORF Transcript_9086/g.16933 Transcript_9086/m.16933 type:complete len:211 (+) Transcript_9086:1109-1741(+)